MPSFSTGPTFCLIPAVSMSVTGTPPTSRLTDTRSRVVPASFETMATGRLAIRFNNVDLPALTGPKSVTCTPSRTRSPILLSCRQSEISAINASTPSPIDATTDVGISSSGKSITASNSAAILMIAWRHRITGLRSAPCICDQACANCWPVSASIISLRLSTPSRSILPL